ncbi:MAG: NAD(P)-dependent oxidoreductase [Verrucomicrobiales bacterium]
MEPDHPPIGVIGMGIIGSGVAKTLRARNRGVFVWSRSPRPIPNFLGSAAEVADTCKTIQIFVDTGSALKSVLGLLQPSLTPSHYVIAHPTISPEEMRESATLVEECGASFLEAPFTGSRDASRAGKLFYYAGGRPEVLEHLRPTLELSAKAIEHFGPVGSASVVKIVTNMLNAAIVNSLSEALVALTSGGLEPAVLEKALAHHAARSPVVDMKLPSMLAGDFEPHFSVSNMLKDQNLALALVGSAQAAGLSVTQAVKERLREAEGRGWGNEDFSALYKLFR